jgi:hypothetical protein
VVLGGRISWIWVGKGGKWVEEEGNCVEQSSVQWGGGEKGMHNGKMEEEGNGRGEGRGGKEEGKGEGGRLRRKGSRRGEGGDG